MTLRSFAGLAAVTLAALVGTVVLAGWGAGGLGAFDASHISDASHVENAAASIGDGAPTPREPAAATTAISIADAAPGDADLPAPVPAPAPALADSSAAEAPAVTPASTEAGPTPPPEPGMRLASVPTSDPADDGAKPRAIAPAHECVTDTVSDTCIDEYLWSLYERTLKVDTIKVPERIKVAVKKQGKARTVTKTVMKYVVDDFTWKDPVAAERAGMSPMDYVIGGMDRGFKLKLYNALRAMDDAGLMPGITSGFRDDYRQLIASGNKAASDSSYHGGSRRGGYRHGLAADLVSVKGDTRMQRAAASEELWQWVDAHGKEFGIGRPYLDRDPPHVGPIEGTEYFVKRGLAKGARTGSGAAKRVSPAKLSKLSSLQKRLTVQR